MATRSAYGSCSWDRTKVTRCTCGRFVARHPAKQYNDIHDSIWVPIVELVKTALEISFVQALEPWLELRGLLRVATSRAEAEIQGGPLVVDRRDQKEEITVRVRGLRIVQEAIGTGTAAISRATELVSALSAESELPPVRQARYDAFFIDAFSQPMHQLVDLFKRRYFSSSHLVDAATDVAVVVDQRDGEIEKHFQVGPMEAEQLRSGILKFPKDELPDQFVFVALGYESSGENDVQVDDLGHFLELAEQWQSGQIESILSDLLGPGG